MIFQKKKATKILPFTIEEFGHYAHKLIAKPAKTSRFCQMYDKALVAHTFLLNRINKSFDLGEISRDDAIRLEAIATNTLKVNYPHEVEEGVFQNLSSSNVGADI